MQLNFRAPQGDWEEDVSSGPNEIVERDYWIGREKNHQDTCNRKVAQKSRSDTIYKDNKCKYAFHTLPQIPAFLSLKDFLAGIVQV